MIARLRARLFAWLGRADPPARSSAEAGASSWREQPAERLIVGLGNPGLEYADTRHNIGFRVVERLAERGDAAWQDAPELEARVAVASIEGHRTWLVEPLTFMNRSGRSVEAALARCPELDPTDSVFVIYDDLDLPTGRLRLRPTGGAGGHRGMRDILDALETRAIPRVRFGVGHPGSSEAVVDWVLAPFDPAEEPQLVEPAIERAADAIEMALREGVPAAMGHFNQDS